MLQIKLTNVLLRKGVEYPFTLSGDIRRIRITPHRSPYSIAVSYVYGNTLKGKAEGYATRERPYDSEYIEVVSPTLYLLTSDVDGLTFDIEYHLYRAESLVTGADIRRFFIPVTGSLAANEVGSNVNWSNLSAWPIPGAAVQAPLTPTALASNVLDGLYWQPQTSTIPNSATIKKIIPHLFVTSSPDPGLFYQVALSSLKLAKNGVVSGNDYVVTDGTGPVWPTDGSIQELILEPQVDPLWGLAWTPADFNTYGNHNNPSLTITTVVQGSGPVSEVQTLTFSTVPTGGTYTLSFNGQTTGAIAYNANAATVQTALTGLSTIGGGNLTVAGSYNTTFTFTFGGTLANSPQNTITGNGDSLSVTPITINDYQQASTGQNQIVRVLTKNSAYPGNGESHAVGFEIHSAAKGDWSNHERYTQVGGTPYMNDEWSIGVGPPNGQWNGFVPTALSYVKTLLTTNTWGGFKNNSYTAADLGITVTDPANIPSPYFAGWDIELKGALAATNFTIVEDASLGWNPGLSEPWQKMPFATPYTNYIRSPYSTPDRGTKIVCDANLYPGTRTAQAGQNEIQSVYLNGATGGTFTLTFGANTTAAQAYNVTAANLKTALEGLGSIGAGNVDVTNPSTGLYLVEFKGTFAQTNVASLTATSSLTGLPIDIVRTTPGNAGTNEVQSVTINNPIAGGQWGLVWNPGTGDETTATLTMPTTASQVQTALENLPTPVPGDIVVSGGTNGPFTVTFQGAFAKTNVNQMTAKPGLGPTFGLALSAQIVSPVFDFFGGTVKAKIVNALVEVVYSL